MHSVFEILEETTASAGPDLITLDQLKFALGIADDSEDARLQAAITFQSRIIADYCDRRFGFAQAMETFHFDPGEYLTARQGLVLKLYPVVQVGEVSTLGATAGGWHVDPETGRLWIGATAPGDVISVVYAGGYDLPEEAPARLQQAIILSVNESRNSGTRDPGIQSVQHGDTRVSYFSSTTSTGTAGYLSAPVIDLVRAYKRVNIA